MIELRVPPGVESAQALGAIKAIAWEHPGEERLTLLVGSRRLELGASWGFSGSEECRAALSEYGELVAPRGNPR